MNGLLIIAVAILGGLIVVGLLAVRWALRTMARGKARFEAEARARADEEPELCPEPPPRSDPQAVVTRERIIERQVLVVRCSFCKKLTPADLSACDNCGAKP